MNILEYIQSCKNLQIFARSLGTFFTKAHHTSSLVFTEAIKVHSPQQVLSFEIFKTSIKHLTPCLKLSTYRNSSQYWLLS